MRIRDLQSLILDTLTTEFRFDTHVWHDVTVKADAILNRPNARRPPFNRPQFYTAIDNLDELGLIETSFAEYDPTKDHEHPVPLDGSSGPRALYRRRPQP